MVFKIYFYKYLANIFVVSTLDFAESLLHKILNYIHFPLALKTQIFTRLTHCLVDGSTAFYSAANCR